MTGKDSEQSSGDSMDPKDRRPEGGGVTRRRFVGSTVAAAGAAIVWGSPFPFSRAGIGQSIESANAAAGPTGPFGSADEPHDADPTLPPGMTPQQAVFDLLAFSTAAGGDADLLARINAAAARIPLFDSQRTGALNTFLARQFAARQALATRVPAATAAEKLALATAQIAALEVFLAG